jgi:voltage-gated potassium channel
MSAEQQPIEMAIPLEIARNRTRTRRFLTTIETRNRYTALLIVIVAMMLVLPLIARDELALFSMKVAVSIILVFGIYVGRRLRRDLVVGAALGIPVLVGRWLPQYSTDIRMFLAIDILTAAFLLYITIIILSQVLSARRVTLDTIAGAMCSYCLIGLAWAFAYRVMFVANPHAFVFAAGSFHIFENNSHSEPQLMNFAYYSFATLTTTGFSDVTPAVGVSRAVSVLEAVAGQFFLAILIARLVSLEIIHSMNRGRE